MTGARTILLIDDDPDIRDVLQTVLRVEGYRIVTAEDGNLGLALVERESPDLVIVDMMMPKKSGLLVLKTVKSRPIKTPKVIMITANEVSRHKAYAEELGVDDYIAKPFDVDRLVASVRRLCPLGTTEREPDR